MRDQLDAAQDERAHEDVAQLGVVLHERHELRTIQLDHFTRLGRARTNERRPSREHVGLAGELARSMLDDQIVRCRTPARPDDLDRAARDHEERHGSIAGLDEHVAARDVACPAVPADTRHLLTRERGKHMFGAGAGRESRGHEAIGHDLESLQVYPFAVASPDELGYG